MNKPTTRIRVVMAMLLVLVMLFGTVTVLAGCGKKEESLEEIMMYYTYNR